MDKAEYTQVKSLVQEAVKLKQEKRLDEARELLEQGAEDYPYNNYLKSSLADLYFRQQQLDSALALADEVLSKKPGHAQALIVKGNIAFAKRKFEEALEYYQQAYLNNQGQYLASRIIRTYIKLEDYDEALSLCQEWLERKPDQAEFKRQLAAIYEKMDKADKAKEIYQDYLAEKPEDEFAYKEKIKLMIKDKKPAAAVRELRTLLSVGNRSNNIHLHTLLAEQLEKMDKYQEAVEEYQSALELKPDNLFVLKQLGFALHKVGEEKQALTYLKEAFTQDPGDYYIRSTLYAIFKSLSREKEGIEFFTGIIHSNPAYKNLWGVVRKLSKDIENKESDQDDSTEN